MSIPSIDLANRFLAPLKGNLTILILHDTRARLRLARLMLTCARAHPSHPTILDVDAFYCTHAEELSDQAQPISSAELLIMPEGTFDADLLTALLSSKREVLIIDDLNSLYTLASDGRELHQLSIIMRLLSHNASLNGSWVIATAYRTEFGDGREKKANRRSLAALGDLIVDTEFSDGSLQLKAGFKGPWQDDELAV